MTQPITTTKGLSRIVFVQGKYLVANFSNHGSHAGGNDVARVWELAANGEFRLVTEKTLGRSHAMTALPNGQVAYARHHPTFTVLILSVPSLDIVREIKTGHGNGINSIAYCAPNYLITGPGSGDTKVKMWNINTGESVGVFDGHHDYIHGLTASPDGQWFACNAGNKTTFVWNPANSRAPLYKLPGTGTSLKALSDKLLATPMESGDIYIYDVTSGTRIHTLKGHTWSVDTMELFDNLLVSAGHDKTIRVWDLATYQCVETLKGHKDIVNALQLLPNKTLASACAKTGTIRFWRNDRFPELTSTFLSNQPPSSQQQPTLSQKEQIRQSLKAKGAVAWWDMDGSVSNIMSPEMASNRNNIEFVDGQVGQGIKFNTQGFLNIPHVESLAQQKITLEAWVKPLGVGGKDSDVLGSIILEKTVQSQ